MVVSSVVSKVDLMVVPTVGHLAVALAATKAAPRVGRRAAQRAAWKADSMVAPMVA